MSYAAYLGGEMVFTKGTNFNHTAWEGSSDTFEAVMPIEQVEENKLYRVMVSGVPVVLLRQGLRFSAIAATCSHAGGPLDEGSLAGDVVQCPWHGSRFCMRMAVYSPAPRRPERRAMKCASRMARSN